MPHHTPPQLSSSILLVLSLRAACAANSPGGWPPIDSNGAHHFSALGLFGKSGGNLQPVIGTVSKYHKNPLFNQDKPWEPRLDNGYPNIVYDSQSQGDGPWRLWYGGIGVGGQYLYYANSTDGLSWEKPVLNRYDLGDRWPALKSIGKKNNIVMFGGGLGILLDSHEPNPALRYKISGGAPAGCYSDNGSANCLTGTAGSPDGINNWTDVKKLEFSRPWRADCHTNIIYDPPSAQYYMTTRDYENGDGREISIANASVFDHWTQPTIVEKGSGAHQLYSQITWRFYDVFLGIVMVFDAETGSKGPDAGHVHCMLSWAPTALGPWEWVDVKGLEGLSEFIPKGPPGSFESHVCFAAHLPLRMPDGTTRIYYMGGNGPHSGARNSSFGLATLGPDRFAGVTSMESHSSMGTSVSSSVLVTGNSMMATFDIVEPDGSVTVAILAGKAKYTSKPISCGSQECTDTSLEFPELPSGLSSLAGKLVQLELTVVKAVVYTLGFK